MARRPTAAMLATFVVVVAASTAFAGGHDASGARIVERVVIVGAVAGDGTPEPSGNPSSDGAWAARRTSAGRYVVELVAAPPAPSDLRVSLELTAWDAPVRAVVTPSAGGTVAVAFDQDGLPVDTRFTFTLVGSGS